MMTSRSIVLLCGLILVAEPVSAQIILQHNFDDGTDGPFTPLGPGWAVIDGTYHCHTEGFASGSSSLAGDPNWSDYIVAFDVRTEGSVGQLLYRRVVDFLDYYQVAIRGAPYNDVQVFRMDYIVNDPHLVLIGAATFPTQSGVWHHVEVQVIDYSFYVEIDGTLALQCVDTAHPPTVRYGSIALVCFAGGNVLWQDVWYDNVEVRATAVATEAITGVASRHCSSKDRTPICAPVVGSPRRAH